MKTKLLNKIWLRTLAVVAVMTTAFAGQAWGETVTFTFNTDEGLQDLGIAKPEASKGTDLGDKTYQLGTISLNATDGGTNTRVWNSSGKTDLRIYTNGTLTFTSSSDNITSIVLSGGTVNGFTASVDIFASGTWSGSAKSVTLTATGTEKINTIAVTTGGTPVVVIPAPTLSPSAGEVEAGTKVTISNYNSNYLYYYTADGMTPEVDEDGLADNESTKAFPTDGYAINANTTLKVIATDGKGNVSDVTTAAYTVNIPVGDYKWVETPIANLTSSDVFVIVGNGFAMTNNNGTQNPPIAVSVTITDGKITSTIENKLLWTVSGDATEGYTFYPNGSTTTWLYCNTTAATSSNNNMRVGTGNRKVFVLNSDNQLETKDTNTKRYLSIYNNQDWRGYINTDSAPAIKFYKRVDADAPDVPYLSADNVEIEYDATSGAIAFSISNPVSGGVLTASTTADWLTLGTAGAATITFTCSSNPTKTARTASVTLTYTYNTSETVTATVTVSQEGNPSVAYTTIPELFADATKTATEVSVTFNNWVVSGVSTNGKNVFVTDGTNGFMIYSSSDQSSTFRAGDILSGTALCKLQLYNGFAELTDLTASDLTITAGGNVSVANIALADLSGVNTGAVVSYNNLTCSVDNNKYYLSDGTTTIQVYNTLYAFDALEAGKTYSITGVYQQYNTTKEVLPRSAADIVEGSAVTIGSAGWASVVVLADVAMPEGVMGYIVTEAANGSAKLAEVQAVPANTPILVQGAAGTYTFNEATTTDAVTGNLLLASNGSIVGDGSSIYVLSTGNSGVGFYLLASGTPVPAGKCYLEVTGGARSFISFGDETAINSIKAEGQFSEFFDLQGRRVAQPAKGLYIVNGKKVVIK